MNKGGGVNDFFMKIYNKILHESTEKQNKNLSCYPMEVKT